MNEKRNKLMFKINEYLLKEYDCVFTEEAMNAVFDIIDSHDDDECKHNEGTVASWDYVTCKRCGMIKTGGNWGVASNKWFAGKSEAEFFKKNGRRSEA